jgi:hypothetical protein
MLRLRRDRTGALDEILALGYSREPPPATT